LSDPIADSIVMVDERNTGWRRVLTRPSAYEMAQGLIGAERAFDRLVAEYLRPAANMVLVDIGCGTGKLGKRLSSLNYWGFDPNPGYIAAAHRDQVPNTFVAAIGDRDLLSRLPRSADLVTLLGVFHHLDDSLVDQGARLAASLLAENGRMISFDPAFVDGQSTVAKRLAAADRGRFVRTPDQLERLLAPHFPKLQCSIEHSFLRVPYTHVLFTGHASAAAPVVYTTSQGGQDED
jgi:SAM-dependent methyltransferase